MPENTLIAIHGNLQQPAVWENFRGKLRDAQDKPLAWHAENLWADSAPHGQATSFAAWTDNFCTRVESETKTDTKPWLLGYSLGGRLALHALLHQPTLWHGAIIVAAHPGLGDADEKAARLQNDRRWAERFRTEPWDALMAEWDAQAVFGGRTNPQPPQEKDFDRARVASFFESFSLGQQDNLLRKLAAAHLPPTLYLSGEDDVKFTAIGQQLASTCPAITHQVIPNAAHRNPWEQPIKFSDAVREFVSD